MKAVLRKRFSRRVVGFLSTVMVGVSFYAYAETTVPHTFTSGTVAKANEVNENFKVLAGAINAVPAGPQGPKGDKGDTGATGPVVATGATGPAGVASATLPLILTGSNISLPGVTIGDTNIAIGFDALSNTTGTNNTANGREALFSNTAGNFNTANGRDALLLNTTGSSNTANGVSALVNNTTGDSNTANGRSALIRNTTGSFNTAIGRAADVLTGDLTNATAIGANALVNASNKIRLGDSAVTVIEGEVDFTFTSDKNKKENFEEVDGEAVLKKIRGMNLTSWNYIGHDPKQFRHYGPMAQDFFAAFGNDKIGTIGTPTTITGNDLAGILLIAVQTLEAQNAKQASQINDQSEQIQQQAKQIQQQAGQITLLMDDNAAFKVRLDRVIGKGEVAEAVHDVP
jgi:hypothetical protein